MDPEAQKMLFLVRNLGNPTPPHLGMHPKFGEFIGRIHNEIVHFRAQNPNLYETEMMKHSGFPPQHVPAPDLRAQRARNDQEEVKDMVDSIMNRGPSGNKSGIAASMEQYIEGMLQRATDYDTFHNQYLIHFLNEALDNFNRHKEQIERVNGLSERIDRALTVHTSAVVIQELDVEIAQVEKPALLEALSSRSSQGSQGSHAVQQNPPKTSEAVRPPASNDLGMEDLHDEVFGSQGSHPVQQNPSRTSEAVRPPESEDDEVFESSSPKSVRTSAPEVNPSSQSRILKDASTMENIRRILNTFCTSSSSTTPSGTEEQEQLNVEEKVPEDVAQTVSEARSLQVPEMLDQLSTVTLERISEDSLTTSETIGQGNVSDALPSCQSPAVNTLEQTPIAPDFSTSSKKPENKKFHVKRAPIVIRQKISSFSTSRGIEKKKTFYLRLKGKKRWISEKMVKRITMVGRLKFSKKCDSKQVEEEESSDDEPPPSPSPTPSPSSSDEEFVQKTPMRKKISFGFLNRPILRPARCFDDSPVKRTEEEDKKLMFLERQLRTDLKPMALVPKSHRKRSAVDDEYEGFEVTRMRFEYKQLLFDVDEPSLSGRTHKKVVRRLDQINRGFEASMVQEFRRTNPEEFHDVHSKYLDFKKDEAEAKEKGIDIKVPQTITVEKHHPMKFSIRNVSKDHDVFYVVSYPDSLAIDNPNGMITKDGKVTLTVKLCSSRMDDDVHVGYHWGEEGDAPRLSKKIDVVVHK